MMPARTDSSDANPDHADPGKVVIDARASNGSTIRIRAIRPSDEPRLREGISHLSDESRYLRFFSAQPMPADAVIERLVRADGHDHLAWGALDIGGAEELAVGAVHAMRRPDEPQRAEFSIALLDAYHGIGIARMLAAVLLAHCHAEGIKGLDIQTLAHNQSAIALVTRLGARPAGTAAGVSEFRLDVVPALGRIQVEPGTEGVSAVLGAMGRWLPAMGKSERRDPAPMRHRPRRSSPVPFARRAPRSSSSLPAGDHHLRR
jgi:RimJ/RimL family protein N-acetyltransferase